MSGRLAARGNSSSLAPLSRSKTCSCLRPPPIRVESTIGGVVSHRAVALRCKPVAAAAPTGKVQMEVEAPPAIPFIGMHHVGIICQNLERSMQFYQGVLGLELNPERPEERLTYRGAWFWVGPEMIHLMELPNPDPMEGRPEYGGRDRHFCTGVSDIKPLLQRLDRAGIPYSLSKGRRAVFFRDPDMNTLEVSELDPWH